ncbi:MAG TPA: histidinol dehydrogenase [Nitrospirae bacterium]|nr:histidinol dehydrogenase [Nitrospirota bacterium]HDZ87043.1 histidinol dehydrogenase [Nitrospirota bacterium]
MKIIETRKDLESFLCMLKKRASGLGGTVISDTRQILDDVRKQGDKAIIKYTGRFDGVSPGSLRINKKEIARACCKADAKVVRALGVSARRIRRFHKNQREKSWSISYEGATMGQIVRPIERVGIYVPGGKAAYPSTVLMNVIPAQVAGVKEIALCVPAPGGDVNPYVMAAVNMLGINEVYRIGGAQAIGALAFGTKTIRKVDKIVGPGNIYVATAKKLVFGEVDIDMIAGPSEVLVIADKTADPSFIAADLLSQAEHDEFASALCVTDSRVMAHRVNDEVIKQLITLSRNEIAATSLKNFGAIIYVKNMEKAAEVSNMVAPEHLEIMTKSPGSVLRDIKNAGAIFLGKWTPEPLGDYSAGPNHTLPTGGTSRFFSPLGVYDFVKRSSLLEFTKDGFDKLSGTVEKIAGIEGLEAHANAIRIRKKC